MKAKSNFLPDIFFARYRHNKMTDETPVAPEATPEVPAEESAEEVEETPEADEVASEEEVA